MRRIARVEVDKQSCLSSGRCTEKAPEAFQLDVDFLAQVTSEALNVSEESLEAIARACPGLAIHLYRVQP